MPHVLSPVTRGALLGLVIVLAISVPARAGLGGDEGTVDAPTVPGIVMVQFRAGVRVQEGAGKTGRRAFDALAAQHGVYAVERAFPMLDAVAAKQGLSASGDALRRTYVLRYDGPERPAYVAALLARDPAVELAEPQYVRRPTARSAAPDDPLFLASTHLQLLQVPAAWDVVKSEDGNVLLAIVDGGTQWRHVDLEANVWTNPGEIPNNGVDDDANGYVDDVNGWNFTTNAPDPTAPANVPQNRMHGTASAGAAVAVTNNGTGITGTSWNATFIPVGASCPNQDNLICYGFPGILYAAQNGATIINASFGGPGRSEIEQHVIDQARDLGALVVAAAGNDGLNADVTPFYPANYDGVLAVGATAKAADTRAGFSNYGRTVDVFAPGQNVNLTFVDNQFGTTSGTSFAAPLVAGIAALVKTLRPGFTPDQLREQLRVTSDPIDAANPGFEGKLGQGRVNALRAVTVFDRPAIRMTGFTLDRPAVNGGETVEVTATFTNYLADASDVRLTLTTDDPYVTIPSATASPGALASGASVTVTFAFTLGTNAPSNHRLTFFAEAEAGPYRGSDVIRLTANETSVAAHSTPKLLVSITDEGNLGFLEFGDGNSSGLGFRINGQTNVLFEGGLLVATGPDRVTDSVRGSVTCPASQDVDFMLKEGTNLTVIRPADVTDEQGRVELVEAPEDPDRPGYTPIGIAVLQDSFMDDAPDLEDVFFVRYTIFNTTAEVLSNVYAGLFFDWDVDQLDPTRDRGGFDAARGLGYVQNEGGTLLVGSTLLAADAPMTYSAIDNTVSVYCGLSDGGFTGTEKWDFLSGAVRHETMEPTDVSQMIGAGPLVIDPGSSVEVAFALAGGRSLANLQASVDAAKAFWEAVILPTAAEDPVPVPAAFGLQPPYPNPTTASATVAFDLAEPGHVTLAVYDLLGRRVRVLADGLEGPGRHTAVWDGRDGSGGRLAAGLYFVRLTAQGTTTTTVDLQPITVVP